MTRLVSGVVLAAAALAAIWFLPLFALRVIACLVAVLAAHEYLRVASGSAPLPVLGLVALNCWVVSSPGDSMLVLLLAPLAVGGTWWIATKSLEAITTRPVFDLDRLVGMTGQASSDIRGRGTVYVNGEEWTALSKSFIPAGSPIRVVRRSGLALEVEIVIL